MDENVVFLPRRECGESPHRFRWRWTAWRDNAGWITDPVEAPDTRQISRLRIFDRQTFQEMAS